MINRIKDFDERASKTSFENTATAIRSQLDLSSLDRLSKDRPLFVLAIGAVVGVALGWWVKRK